MAGVAEKARFYLERSVPQLREWERKEIFTKDEIRSIVQKRSDFEHRCLAPGVKAEDFTTYAQWEISLDALRKKRCERLKIRHVSSQHATQARVMAIYDRAVFKRPDSKALWLEFLAYTAKVKATKRWRKTMTAVLRLMPRDADLWVLAGRRSAMNGDMGAARGFFMRGCRFCTADEGLWVEYARCELEWLAKVERKKNEPKRGKKVAAIASEQVDDDDAMMFTINDDEDDDADEVILPDPEQAKAAKAVFEKEEAETLENNPAMDGAIPMAIFDVARKQSFFKGSSGETFFDLFASFTNLSVQGKLLQHALEAMQEDFPESPSTWCCYIRRPLVGVSPSTAEFPRGLRDVLARLEEGLAGTSDAAALKEKMVEWADEILALPELDPSIRAVLEHVKTNLA
ncbi:U3 small nucleolar RNA-associated protein 6-domain-containing protein [Plectosphaerella plurivora]|uniref:U3 small nucleolar RNA-associated protein 6-domain-containing protein n=1 Tax=Plectosphaerella plurivora TaxID=936078 RepID=A0A9P8V2U3_9PEZI|nr:U3 small nucleolar RNA-associated protein 6-domain-containing protein [Plectosphaerella plurivora]